MMDFQRRVPKSPAPNLLGNVNAQVQAASGSMAASHIQKTQPARGQGGNKAAAQMKAASGSMAPQPTKGQVSGVAEKPAEKAPDSSMTYMLDRVSMVPMKIPMAIYNKVAHLYGEGHIPELAAKPGDDTLYVNIWDKVNECKMRIPWSAWLKVKKYFLVEIWDRVNNTWMTVPRKIYLKVNQLLGDFDLALVDLVDNVVGSVTVDGAADRLSGAQDLLDGALQLARHGVLPHDAGPM